MPAAEQLTADDLIRLLDLNPHPEGGHYRETFRDAVASDDRAASTAIYFLLKAGEKSRWHAVDAAEGWHWYAGSPLRLEIAATGSRPSTIVLGTDFRAGERPQAIVPADVWQRAESAGAWTLVGCTVAPGFQFSGFKIAPDGFEPGA